MTHLRPYRVAILLLVALAACDDDDYQDDSCTISTVVSGDLGAELPGHDGVACVIPFSGDDGIDVQYVMLAEPELRVSLFISDVTKGMTGAFKTEVRVVDAASTRWTSIDCTVDISEHDFIKAVEFGESYQVRGAGQCAGPLLREGGGSISLAPFEFAVAVTWAG